MAITFPGSSVTLVNARLNQVDAPGSQNFLMNQGAITWDTNGSLWQYVVATADVAYGNYVKISEDGLFTVGAGATTTTNPSTEPASIGCASLVTTLGSLTAIPNTYGGWVFRGYGYHIGNFAASCAQDVKIYTTATAGVVDDSATTLINGLKLITTITTAATSPAWASGLLTTAAA